MSCDGERDDQPADARSGRPGGSSRHRRGTGAPAASRRIPDLTGGIGVRRLLAAAVLLVVGLPLLTVVLSAPGLHLDLGDDLLIYLVAVVAVAVVGGFWPAVLAAIVASLLVNWYFTPPVHTLTIADGKSLLALLLFVTVAVTVSSVVHLAALRARQAARSTEEAEDLLALAQTVLGGADTPGRAARHLTESRGGRAELLERVRGQWVRVAASGPARPPATPVLRAPARDGPGARGRRPGPAAVAAAAGRPRRAGGGRARPGPAAHPGRAGRGAGRGQPDAHRAARRGQPRPAHAAGVHQGERQHAAPDRRGVDRGRRGRAAGHHRAVRGPARRPDRQPARHEQADHRLAAAVPAADRDRRGGARRAARPGRRRPTCR